jgi:formylglycine-generating enzyme required for sulfatase activity
MRRVVIICVCVALALLVAGRIIARYLLSREYVPAIHLGGTPMMRVGSWGNSLDVDIHEVTNKQYAEFEAADYHKPGAYLDVPGFAHPMQPVVGVKFYAAKHFCQACGRRLMTLDDYKFILSHLDGMYECGNSMDTNCAVYSLEYGAKKHPNTVMSKPPNSLGIYDLTGNVWEMLAASKKDGKIPVVGGAYYGPKDWLRIDSLVPRYDNLRDVRSDDVGFRCVKDVKSGAFIPDLGSNNKNTTD